MTDYKEVTKLLNKYEMAFEEHDISNEKGKCGRVVMLENPKTWIRGFHFNCIGKLVAFIGD